MLVMLLFSASLAGSAVCEDEADATGSYIVTNTPRMRSQRSASATSERSGVIHPVIYANHIPVHRHFLYDPITIFTSESIMSSIL